MSSLPVCTLLILTRARLLRLSKRYLDDVEVARMHLVGAHGDVDFFISEISGWRARQGRRDRRG